jgi:hypothetical protein
MSELESLRVSVARVAQSLQVDNYLHVTDKGYGALCALAKEQERGWNDLAGLCAAKAQSLLEAQS